MLPLINRIWRFYYEGFKNMSWWGKRAWVIILIKLFIIFAILRVFFFQDFLGSRFADEHDRSVYVMDQLINSEK